MLINFIGCPASGKTTTAAMLFAKLKEQGISSEFICEEARKYIMTQRWNRGLSPETELSLTDEDQEMIMSEQWGIEEMITTVCGPSVVVVCDSSALNALLYMSPECRHRMLPRIELAKRQIDLAFYLPPVNTLNSFDPNRVHDQAESLKIDRELLSVFAEHVPGLRLIRIDGTPQERLDKVLFEVEGHR